MAVYTRKSLNLMMADPALAEARIVVSGHISPAMLAFVLYMGNGNRSLGMRRCIAFAAKRSDEILAEYPLTDEAGKPVPPHNPLREKSAFDE